MLKSITVDTALLFCARQPYPDSLQQTACLLLPQLDMTLQGTKAHAPC